MINTNNMKKIKTIKIIIYLVFSIIISRLFYLQIINYEYYQEILNSKISKLIYKNSNLRGKIYDSNNNLLVDNKLIMNIIYKKVDGIKTNEEINLAYEVSKYIDLDYQKLTTSYLKDFFILTNEKIINERVKEEYKLYQNRKLNNNEFYKIKKDKVLESDLSIYTDKDLKAIYLYYLMTNGYSYMNKIIKENCSINEFIFFSENNSNLKGFDTEYSYGRVYNYNDTFKNILGKVGSISYENKDYYLNSGYSLNDKVGLTNLEFIYDNYLRSENDIYKLENGELILLKKGKKGNDLVLTIDINLQKYVDDILTNEVINAKKNYNSKYYNHSYVLISDTFGNILSMNGKQIINDKIYDISIGNITDTVTVGSSIKGVSMLVGYDTNAIKIGEVMKDECLKIKSTPKKCSVYQMGYINDLEALINSSNVYQFKTSIRVGGGNYSYNQSLKVKDEAFSIYREYFSRFGLGVNTGIELLNESKGYKGSNKNAGLLMDFAIGQYDTYTNIQLNQYISTLARDGNRYQMHLLKEVRDNSNNIIIKEFSSNILNNVNIELKYIKRVKEGLRLVMTSGTGRGYTNYDLNASGKTGTSESFYDSDFDGKIDTETTSTTFVMYMPSDNPKIAISMVSPNIAYLNGYKYPINKNVIKNITDNYYKIVK